MRIAGLIILMFCFVQQSVFANWEEETHQDEKVYSYYPEGDGEKSLMIALHGCNQNSRFMKKSGNWERPAEKHSMIVVSPNVLNGGVLLGCWDYFNSSQHNERPMVKYLVSLVEKFLSNPELNINKNKVFISGFSSGGAMSLVMSCLRPDLFAGVAAAAGPSLGTSVVESRFPSTTGKRTAKLCRKYAGEKADYLKTMVSSFIGADVDGVVHSKYNKINADMFVSLTDVDLYKSELDIDELVNFATKGKAFIWDDGDGERISHIINDGIRHNWPAGSSGNFVELETTHDIDIQFSFRRDSMNFPEFVTNFLLKNNMRNEEFIFGR